MHIPSFMSILADFISQSCTSAMDWYKPFQETGFPIELAWELTAGTHLNRSLYTYQIGHTLSLHLTALEDHPTCDEQGQKWAILWYTAICPHLQSAKWSYCSSSNHLTTIFPCTDARYSLGPRNPIWIYTVTYMIQTLPIYLMRVV